MDLQSAGLLGVLYALIKIVEKLVDKREKKNAPSGENILQQLAALMEAHTHRLNSIDSKFGSYDRVLLATDENLTPNVWTDKRQSKRTHESVNVIHEGINTLLETTHKIHKVSSETNEMFKKVL